MGVHSLPHWNLITFIPANIFNPKWYLWLLIQAYTVFTLSTALHLTIMASIWKSYLTFYSYNDYNLLFIQWLHIFTATLGLTSVTVMYEGGCDKSGIQHCHLLREVVPPVEKYHICAGHPVPCCIRLRHLIYYLICVLKCYKVAAVHLTFIS